MKTEMMIHLRGSIILRNFVEAEREADRVQHIERLLVESPEKSLALFTRYFTTAQTAMNVFGGRAK